MQASKPWILRHAGPLSILFVGVLLPLGLFGSLAEDVVEKQALSFDQPILMFLHAHATPLFDSLMYFFTKTGSALMLVPLFAAVLVLLIRSGKRNSAMFWTLSLGGAALINFLCKLAFSRVRPALWISRVHETTYSFPSGHAMASMALVAALCFLLWNTRWRWLVVVAGALFVLLVGMSRVYWGVHYPSDIVAGWAASLAWVAGLKVVFDHRRPGDTRDRIALPARG